MHSRSRRHRNRRYGQRKPKDRRAKEKHRQRTITVTERLLEGTYRVKRQRPAWPPKATPLYSTSELLKLIQTVAKRQFYVVRSLDVTESMANPFTWEVKGYLQACSPRTKYFNKKRLESAIANRLPSTMTVKMELEIDYPEPLI